MLRPIHAAVPSCCLTLLLIAASVVPAAADCWYLPDPASTYTNVAVPVETSIWILPDGTGRRLDQAFAYGGTPVAQALELIVLGYGGDFLPSIEPEDVWLEVPGAGDLRFCTSGWHPDGWEPAQATFTWSGSPMGGGSRSHDAASIEIKICNVVIPFYPPHFFAFNSPDIDGDLQVNLTDVSLFVQDLHGTYDYRSDFVWDGVVNLADLAVLAAAVGKTCP